MGALQWLSAQLCRANIRLDVGPYLSDLCCVVIGQFAMGRSLMDRSIASLATAFTKRTPTLSKMCLGDSDHITLNVILFQKKFLLSTAAALPTK